MTTDKKLMRPKDGALIGGVCAAFARYYGIDATVIRLVWVLLVCLGGTGLLAYLICWIVIPREPSATI
jgi:phage shock protein PspC (stress-responsive transcriptional regulator)